MINPYIQMPSGEIYQGDVLDILAQLPEQSVHTCVTSPPYWGLRDYGTPGQIGLEKTPQEYTGKMVEVFRQIWRVLRDDGTVWLNIGDSYAGNVSRASNGGRAGYGTKREGVFNRTPDGLKPKDLCGIPWRLAFALQDDGWYLRSDIIWHKPNPMPESVTDRPTKAHEYLFLLSKKETYYYDAEAIKEQTYKTGGRPRQFGATEQNGTFRNDVGETFVDTGQRNKRTVWTVTTKPYSEAHFATFPPDLIKPCILAGCPAQGTVLDPFMGSGTTAIVAQQHDRRWVGVELNEKYCKMAERRILKEAGQFSQMNLL